MFAGCGSKRSASRATATESVASGTAKGDYVELFRTGQYSASYESAVAAAVKGRAAEREKAALIAGLSAHALDRNAEAARWLKPLQESRDATIAGKALVTLGLVAQERGEHNDAAAMLSLASTKLQGDEAGRAAMYAGDSYRALGSKSKADELYAKAQQLASTDGQLRVLAGDRLRGIAPGPGVIGRATSSSPLVVPGTTPRYTVQAGAYEELRRAQREAQKLSSRFAVRVVPIRKGRSTLYAVRVGMFSSRDAADVVRKQVGGRASITLPTGE
jgi:tetratricopeptide (TPR) repeat protein